MLMRTFEQIFYCTLASNFLIELIVPEKYGFTVNLITSLKYASTQFTFFDDYYWIKLVQITKIASFVS